VKEEGKEELVWLLCSRGLSSVRMFSLFNVALLSVAVHYQTVNSVLLWGLRVERKINGRGREMQKE
jgi:hypothetical protein